MKAGFIGLVFLSFVGVACRQKNGLPAWALAPIPVEVSRFDQDFFAIDTTRLDSGLNYLATKYPDFYPAYLTAVLGINPADTLAATAVKAFIASYRPVFFEGDLVVKQYEAAWKQQIERGLQWLRYLVPGFKPDSPFVLTPFIGPMDAFEAFSTGDYGDVRTTNGAGIAMQLHLGQQNEWYNQGLQTGVFYRYQVRRFEPDMVVVNIMKTVLDDVFPYKAEGKPLVAEMVEKGKRMALLKRCLPEVPDSLLVGYSGTQLEGCLTNEGIIWQFFVKNDLLYGTDPSINQQYIKDGPKTPELGEASPGYIGLFTGWRIVEKYLENNPDIKITELMAMDPEVLFQQSRYKPD